MLTFVLLQDERLFYFRVCKKTCKKEMKRKKNACSQKEFKGKGPFQKGVYDVQESINRLEFCRS